MPNTSLLSRRAAFAAFSFPAASAFIGSARAAPLADTSALRDACFLTPQSIEGPYYLDPRLVRSQIAEGRIGVPLRVNLRVVDGATCEPSAAARVDLWHADALGIYSGYEGQGDRQDISTVGQKFLRGTQFTDNKGAVSFETIYPGWYTGRATHMHFKVLLDDRNVLTGQMYFPDAVNEFIYANVSAYLNRANPRSVVNANDRFANFHDPNRLSFCAIKEERDCYAASLVLAVDRFAVAHAERPAREGEGATQPAVDRVRLLIPGSSLK
jgi:protocatechuate 3,4-dioxygenase beta subunit